ncbi:non-ribosomal peptide synthetase [Aspergillus stella-maris]|uniref:non-ribosomal peptide synthetase n=1 Tax=Aspergillus stella-maris TaxID=1810926 RepID=UPI003CCD17A4
MGSILPDVSEYDRVISRGEGLGQIFYRRMLENPEAIAIIDEQKQSLSYQSVHEKALELAQTLSRHECSPGDRVGVIVDHGLLDAVTQVAIIYTGGTCVPIDPLLPDQQIERRLMKLGVQHVLVDKANASRDVPFTLFVVSDGGEEPSKTDEEGSEHGSFPIPTSVDQCSHLIHTSGTTSEPKAVQIAARSIIHVAHHAPYEPVRKSDVVGHPNKTSFDVALFDIWGALLRGAAVGVLSKTTLLDSAALAAAIRRLKITITAITAPLVNLAATTYPTTFAPLRVVLMGGEAVNLRAMEAILNAGPPTHLMNAYGPTECCVYCLTHEITFEDIRAGKVSIGETIGRNVSCVCDEDGNPVPAGEEGELLVGGPGVSPGYVDQAEKNAKTFIPVPSMPDPESNQPYRMYRTGDLVRQRPDGQHDFLGRRDEQVKIRGFRVELAAVRSVLMGTGYFVEVFAMAMNSQAAGASSSLVTFAILHSDAAKTAVADAVEVARAALPDYMVPHIEVVAEMPLNAHAKIDRRGLEDMYNQRRKRLLEKTNGYAEEKKAISTRQRIARIWAMILATPVPEYADEDDFFAMGGTSLQASMLITRIRKELNTKISLLTLYDHPTLGELASIVDKHQGSSMATIRDEQDILAADIKLGDDLKLPQTPVVDWHRDTEGRVFLTGATGFVGAFYVASLLQMPGVYQVGCLVRAATPAKGLLRIRDALVKYGLWQDSFSSRILPLCGTLEDHWLGMGEERFHEVAIWSSVVFHLGALVNYTKPYSLHRPANVIGTANIARFAVTGRPKGLHYCSSISCFGPTGFVNGAKIIYEDASLLPHLSALPYDHGYAQSQWAADALLQRLMNRGFPIAIYRPGFITGDSATGVCNPDDFFSRLIRAGLDLGCYPDLPDQRKEFVPVDYVVAAMIRISSSPFTLGHAFHLLPSRAASVDMTQTMELLSQVRGSAIQRLGYEEWIEQLSSSSHASLQPLLPMLAEKVRDGLTRWELYERMPTYDATNTQRALATLSLESPLESPLECPAFDRGLVKKYVDYLFALEKGLV